MALGTSAWLLALSGAWLLLSSAVDFHAGMRAASWPVVEGDVVDVQTRKVLVGRFLPLQTRVEPTYEYLVDAVRYRNSRVSFNGILPQELASALSAAGSRVAVHYNPGNPGESVLYTGAGLSLWLYGGVGLFFLVVSVVVMRYAETPPPVVKGRRRKRKS
jgi:hypothetical protein